MPKHFWIFFLFSEKIEWISNDIFMKRKTVVYLSWYIYQKKGACAPFFDIYRE